MYVATMLFSSLRSTEDRLVSGGVLQEDFIGQGVFSNHFKSRA